MSVFRRFFSRAWRHAARAELAGEHEIAARAWVQAGEPARAARAHLRRALRLEGDARTAALRDAVEACAGEPTAALALAEALLAPIGAREPVSPDERRRAGEAAALFERGGDALRAGALWERLGDDEAAAGAYERGGHVDAMELVLGRVGERRLRRHRYRNAFADFEARLAAGERAHALAALRAATEAADEDRPALASRLDELTARRPARGRVGLRILDGAGPDAARLEVVGGARVRLGRDPACELPLRAQGVSREHVELSWIDRAWQVRDAGSRAGTRLGGLALGGTVPLPPSGTLALGDALELAVSLVGPAARLEVTSGLDRGLVAWVVAPGTRLDVGPLLGLATRLEVGFSESSTEAAASSAGWPIARARGLTVAGHPVAEVDVELLRGDVLELAGTRVEIV